MQLPGKSQGFEGVGINDGGVVSQCGCRLDCLDTGLDEVGAPDMVFAKEALQGIAPGAFNLFEGGPSGDEGTKDAGLLVAEPLYGLWIIGFEGADKP